MNENEITDSFNLMSNSIFDNILPDSNDPWDHDDDFARKTIEEIPLLPDLEDFCMMNNISQMEDIKGEEFNAPPAPSSPQLAHDCMWSGTCNGSDHKIQKRFHFSYVNNFLDKYFNDGKV